MINYAKYPNVFSSERVSIILSNFFGTCKYPQLASKINSYLKRYVAISNDRPDADELKKVKKYNLSQFTELILDGRCHNKYLQDIYDFEPDKARALNIIMTLCRWPEWFIHTEEFLNSISTELDKHIDEINAISYYKADGSRICPYNPEVIMDMHNLFGILEQQEPYVEGFCKAEGISSDISVSMVKAELMQILTDYTVNYTIANIDSFEKGFYDSILYIRRNVHKTLRRMERIFKGQAKAEDYSRSESRAEITDVPGIMQILHKLGFNKSSCPGVLSNIFHCQWGDLNYQKSEGQIEIYYDALYFGAAPGLGPAGKIRYVFNIGIEAQNFLTPLADLCKEADTKFDSWQECYVDQLTPLVSELPIISDAYCTDATGYSDYLIRAIYDYLMQMYGIPLEFRKIIMKFLGAPIKIKDKLYDVKFGAMQGCKLLVFIMNHANRLIGILTRRIQKKLGRDVIPDSRHNAGDDVVTISYHNDFSEQNIHDEMKVFAIFNCPTNPSKSAWLKKNGYFDFCSKYFGRIDGVLTSVTGLPPKIVGKEFLCIKSYAELFKVAEKSKTPRNRIEDVTSRIEPILISEWKEGITLPNVFGIKWNLDEKIAAAKEVSFELGGLIEDSSVDIAKMAKHAKILLEKMLNNYRFNPIGVFLVIQKLQILDTELGKALGTVERIATQEIMTAIAMLQDAIDNDVYEVEDIKRAYGIVSKLERNIIKGLSISSTSSTYHRITLSRDIDTFIAEKELDKETPLVDSIQRPASKLELGLFIATMRDENYTQIDNLRHYIQARTLINALKDRIYDRNHWGIINYYGIDDDDKVIRLTSDSREDWDTYKDNGDPRCHKHPSKIINAQLREFYDIVNGNWELIRDIIDGTADIYRKSWNGILYSMLNREVELMGREMLRKQSADLIKRIITKPEV